MKKFFFFLLFLNFLLISPSKTFETNKSWFQDPLIGCENVEDLGYTYGSCVSSELSAKKIINFPCSFDIKFKKEIQTQINSFLLLKE